MLRLVLLALVCLTACGLHQPPFSYPFDPRREMVLDVGYDGEVGDDHLTDLTRAMEVWNVAVGRTVLRYTNKNPRIVVRLADYLGKSERGDLIGIANPSVVLPMQIYYLDRLKGASRLNIITHELGHCLALPHNPNKASVMHEDVFDGSSPLPDEADMMKVRNLWR